MGNTTSHIGKVILSNGAVHEFHEPLTAAELMLEHQQHVVVKFDKYRSEKPRPLPADAWLDTKNVYLLVPVRKGKVMGVTLSPKEVKRLVSRSAYSSLMMKLKVILPCVGVSSNMCSLFRKDCVKECLLKRTTCRSGESQPEIWEERQAYSFSRGWRPSLDTIVEKAIERKVSHWLY